jgi:hypothetical protein
MTETPIVLTEGDAELLRRLANQTGKAQAEIIREALGLLKQHLVSQHHEERRDRLRQAKGIWKNRDDLPSRAETWVERSSASTE